MRKKILLVLFFTILLTTISVKKSYADSLNSEYLDIRLTNPLIQTNIINMASDSGFSIYDKNEKDIILLTISETTIMAVLNDDCINLMNSKNDILFKLPRDNNYLIASNEIENSKIKIEKDRYRGYIRLINKNNEILVINHVSIEEYLYGVVPKEMTPSFHIEALKAQAVAARSFAISNINKHLTDGFSLCDTTHCQVYYGYEVEKPSTNLAVDETKDILAFYDGKIIDAQYHSTSSGFTESSSNVWGGDLPYLKSVEDSFSADSPYINWSLRISLLELNNKLINSGINLGDLKGIEPMGITSTGKVDKVKLVGTIGEEIINVTQFRNIVGNTTFKSAWFNIQNNNMDGTSNIVYVMDGTMIKPKTIDINKAYIVDRKEKKTVSRGAVNRIQGKDKLENIEGYYPVSTQEITITGKGYGHGVGMSQYGAKKMGELGYNYEEILKYYYTGIEVLRK